ncbi:ATP-dependent Clp protease proteolytic subunit [Haloferula sp. A504]|uniref:ClpP family protease n=1 Tax=Haloferula sp. A504 TaxID=3373601 RepID=UPI0031BD22D6|nr:ATP-dependent Clp protease proteolytic subunit [Verrucomicrobiaceae bacterium E54]
MKTTITRFTLVSLALAGGLHAEAPATPSATATTPPIELKTEAAEAEPAAETVAETQVTEEKTRETQMKEEQERLALENSLLDEQVRKETAKLRAEAARLKAEKELIAERLAHAAMLRKAELEATSAKLQIEAERLNQEAEVAKARAEALTNELKAVQAETTIEITRLRGEISAIETAEKRKAFADSKPQYLENPLREEDNTVVISDRRIPLNDVISTKTADHVTDRIHYFNNQNREQPIFIVIDECPGGSVMAGYRILKAMEASDAPIHVVVKSFAASMAAAITTLAEESYAYPNAVILHHQISATVFGRMNLTQQQEFYKESQRWWTRLATPIAEKMGITTEEFIKKMYEQSTSGDWTEFGEEAKKLGWVNHIVDGIDETSFLRNPDVKTATESATKTTSELQTGVDDDGRPYAVLPRINPKDVYFLYNPDGYYRMP